MRLYKLKIFLRKLTAFCAFCDSSKLLRIVPGWKITCIVLGLTRLDIDNLSLDFNALFFTEILLLLGCILARIMKSCIERVVLM